MSSAERKRKFQRMGRNGAAAAAKSRRYPLRKVVDEGATKEVEGYTLRCWELECGHKVSPPEDLIGPRYPERMRCRQCFEDQAKGGE